VNNPKTIYLADYQAPLFTLEKTKLNFDLYENHAEVRSELTFLANESNSAHPLVLHGQGLTLVSIAIDGTVLDDSRYSVSDDCLTIPNVLTHFTLTCITKIEPQNNTSLEGLYKSQKMFCTQCEAEGFRTITYFPDRPDVMSEFTVRITADKALYPVLLSNGNKIGEGALDEGRHWVEWHDPHKKPSYLFALVAGDLVNLDGYFTTSSGREVLLRIYVEAKDINKCEHAMQSLKKAMKWDEDVYGREYDLDVFMIVAVDDFNMGAMENKGLNIFNTSCVLASSATTTDESFLSIEAIVAHEYFHNWSGNRVTCRDWFQLSLKEGFTVFRDAEFSSDMGSRTVKRVEDVNMLRTHQFAEDAGPMAHAVQPASFIEISNFYTLTVYEKGAEVVRMIHSLLGAALFRQGSDLYFERHDGQAVTIDDFIKAMTDVSGRDFTQFMNWYRQAGTPRVKVRGKYNPDAHTYNLTVKQSCPPTPECEMKLPFHIPMAMGLIGLEGPLSFTLKDNAGESSTHRVVEITEKEQTLVFENVREEPVPSLFRDFSAPIKLDFQYTLTDLARLITRDDDGFCRWDASQQMAVSVIKDVMQALGNEPAPTVNPQLLETHKQLLEQAIEAASGKSEQDLQMLAYTLTLPSEEYLSETQTIIDVECTHHARVRVKRKLAQQFYGLYHDLYTLLDKPKAYSADTQSIAERKLKHTALSYLVASGKQEALALAKSQFDKADNMSDEFSALAELVHSNSQAAIALKEESLAAFYTKWADDTLVMNRWFSVQASSSNPTTLSTVKQLMDHPSFDKNNPNKLRALIGGFCSRNAICFHDRSGKGYAFLSQRILELNDSNPQMASRLLAPLTRWKKYDDQRQQSMRQTLSTLLEHPALSKDVFEVVTKSLA